ncbi:hypothetical protein GMYAFLOJ_CDS0086 [Microbacterium phage phiMiGM15]
MSDLLAHRAGDHEAVRVDAGLHLVGVGEEVACAVEGA